MKNATGISGTQAGCEADLAEFKRLVGELDAVAERMLDRARAAEVGDREAAAGVLAGAGEFGRVGQSSQGRLLLMLAQVQRLGAVPGGLDTWISTHLDVTRGSAVGIMAQAKAVGSVPALAVPLVSGKIGAGTISALTSTARAVRHEDEQTRLEAMTETLAVSQGQGPDKAKRHVQILKETITPG